MLRTYSMAADPASTAEEAAFFAARPTASTTGPEYSIVALATATAASATAALLRERINAESKIVHYPQNLNPPSP